MVRCLDPGSLIWVIPAQVRLTEESLGALSPFLAREPRIEQDYDKVRLYLDDEQSSSRPVSLQAVYVLAPYVDGPESAVWTSQLTYPQALPELVGSTLNVKQMERRTLEAHFGFLGKLMELVPVRRLHYPMEFALLPKVREAALATLPVAVA